MYLTVDSLFLFPSNMYLMHPLVVAIMAVSIPIEPRIRGSELERLLADPPT